MTPLRCPFVATRLRCGLIAAVAGIAIAGTVRAQPGGGGDWKQFEFSQELTAYRLALREGRFDEDSQTFLTGRALPQLAARSNRSSIDRVRRRMRDRLCEDPAADAQALDQAMQTILGFFANAARDQKLDPVVRTNAVLFIGEMRGRDGKPWPAAAAPLAALLGDASLAPALRIAAAQGLVRHVDAAGPQLSATVGPVLVKLLAPPPAGDRVAADWLAARALGMLADMDAPAALAPAAAAVLEDASRPATLRGRAAAALAAAGPTAAGIDWNKAVAACRATARGALETEKARGDRIRDLALLAASAGGPAGEPGPAVRPAAAGSPAGDATIPDLAVRRAEWVLLTLATALAGGDDRGGMAAIGGDHQQAARDLAATLRKAATMISGPPAATSISGAFTLLTGERDSAAPAPAETPPTPAAEEPAFNPFAQ